jgi:hypothetical protein
MAALETRHCVADTHPNGLRFSPLAGTALLSDTQPRSGPLTLRAGRDGRLGYRGVSRDSFRRAFRVAHLDPLGAAAVSGAAKTVAVSLPRWLAAVALLWVDHFCIAAVRAHPEQRRTGLALLWAAERSALLDRRALP